MAGMNKGNPCFEVGIDYKWVLSVIKGLVQWHAAWDHKRGAVRARQGDFGALT